MKNLLLPIIVFMVTWQYPAYGKSDHDHETHKHEETHSDHDEHKHEVDDHEEHGSHEHGAAQMTMAVGETGLEIMLETPAVNVFGFEHKAQSEEDKKTLSLRKAILENSTSLFRINAEAACTELKTEIESPLLAAKKDHAHEAHNDVDVSWRFQCKDTKALKNVTVKLFSAFPNSFEHIKVDWITPTTASTITLNNDGTIQLAK